MGKVGAFYFHISCSVVASLNFLAHEFFGIDWKGRNTFTQNATKFTTTQHNCKKVN